MIKRAAGAALAALLCGLSPAVVAPTAASAATADFPILAGDQNTNKIYRLNPSTWTWDSWTWAPTAGRGYSDAEIAGFNGGNDFRVRNTPAGQRLVVVDGQGLATVATYPDGDRVWANKAPGADNRHSVELLPDGNVAVAASTGGYVRVYSTSSGATASYALEQAHAALWDPQIQRLWVAGSPGYGTTGEYQLLTALEVTGPASAPGLREDTSRALKIPGNDALHDVSADITDPGRLWITTNQRVFTYDKATRQLTTINRGAVKSVGVQPSGQTVETRADRYKTPPGGCTTVNNWCTDTLDFYTPSRTVTRSGAQFYKARVASPHYSAEDTALRGRVFDRAGDTVTRVDNNPAIGRIAAAAGADGRLHVLTLIPGSGMWSRTRGADGDWEDAATQIDESAKITDAAVAAGPDGTLHAFTLIPGAGVWYRKRPAGQPWDAGSTKVDSGTDLTSITAVVNPVTKRPHLLTAGASGVQDRSASATGVWSGTAVQVDTNASIADVAAAALPDGSLHLFTVTAWGGVYHRTGTDTSWTGSASAVPGGGESPATGQVRALAAAGWPAAQLDLVTVRSGLGLWGQTRTGGSWPAPVPLDPDQGALQAYAAHLADGALHTGRIAELS
ncbi:DUF6528 family protein [Actinoplanes siamensis]|uniref:Pyrroloquinoline-quinone binding quinoprotein n=1 Tax=Actinoplanes siamensis TaxID=1223317 RepID=A0A919NCW3_9ACTN|nr:DUF6528 family protein [Actinoplanes siamensis]GIF08399.1 hypothetical protein Asi03nite_59370 [Actinoplanes siamensis]